MHTPLRFALGLTLVTALMACGGNPSSPSQPPSDSAHFSLQPAFTTLELVPGGEVSSFVDLKREAGFADAVQMTFESLPAGFTQEWTRDAADGDCSVRLGVAENVAPGTYTLRLVGKSGTGIQSAALTPQATVTRTVTVVVGPGISGNFFTLSASPNLVEVAQGQFARFRVNVQKGAATTGEAQLSLEAQNGGPLPAGLGVSFASNPVPLGQGTDVQLFATSTLPPGDYLLRVKGTRPSTSGTSTARSDLRLTVRPAADFTFNLTLSPGARMLVQGSSGFTTSVSAQRVAGFGAPVVVSAQNLPAGVTATFSGGTNSCTVTTGTCALSLSLAGTVAPGDYSLTLKGVSEGQVKTAPFTFTVVSGADRPAASNVGSGALEGGFGPGGFAFAPDFNVVHALLPLPNGKTLVAGVGRFQNEGVLALFDGQGALDSGFGTGGLSKAVPFNINAAALLPDGKLAVAGHVVQCAGGGAFGDSPTCTLSLRAARLNANGTLDTSFGTNGVLLSNLSASAGAVFPVAGGKLLLLTGNELIRLTSGGNLDPDFDGDGRKLVDLGGAGARAVLDAQGRIVTVGALSNPPRFQVARLSVDGILDPTFDSDGRASVEGLGVGSGLRPGLTTDAGGRVLLAGTNGTGLAVARLNANGSPDASFSGDGRTVIPVTGQDIGADLAVSGGKITVVGTTTSNVNTADFAAARLNADGSLHGGFGSGGLFRFGFERPFGTGFLGREERFTAALALPGGGVLAAGVSDRQLALASFKP